MFQQVNTCSKLTPQVAVQTDLKHHKPSKQRGHSNKISKIDLEKQKWLDIYDQSCLFELTLHSALPNWKVHQQMDT